MRDAALRIIREIGVDTGGSNIQFAIDPASGRMVVIEMNPRVSRSSALASKATGFPIAKIAARLAVGYRLDEIPNDITRDDAGLLRTDHRLRGDQDSALRLREVSRRGRRARPADEIGRRGDGDRAHLQGIAAEGAALAGNRLVGPREPRASGSRARRSLADDRARHLPCPTAIASITSPTRCGWACARGNPSADQDRSMVHRRDRGNRRDRVARSRRGRSTPRFAARGQGDGLFRSANRGAARSRRRRRSLSGGASSA